MTGKKISLDLLSVLFALAVIAAFVLIVTLTGRKAGKPDPELTFTGQEISLIQSADSLMRVLTVNDSTDLAVLRSKASELSGADLASPLFTKLSRLMVSTMLDSTQAGVGIAGPQVGILKRVVAVQRFDKEGEPVEVYPNVRIESFSGEPAPGREGCLSIPGYYGVVKRYPQIVVTYSDTASFMPVTDTVRGFTAVIFQHETDHLDGILYTDRADSVFVE